MKPYGSAQTTEMRSERDTHAEIGTQASRQSKLGGISSVTQFEVDYPVFADTAKSTRDNFLSINKKRKETRGISSVAQGEVETN